MSNYSCNDVVEYFDNLLHISNDKELLELLFQKNDNVKAKLVKDVISFLGVLRKPQLSDKYDDCITMRYSAICQLPADILFIDLSDPNLIEFYSIVECDSSGEDLMLEFVDEIRNYIYQWQQGKPKANDDSDNFFADAFSINALYNKNEKPMIGAYFNEESDSSIEDYAFKGKLRIRYYCAKPESLEAIAICTYEFLREIVLLCKNNKTLSDFITKNYQILFDVE